MARVDKITRAQIHEALNEAKRLKKGRQAYLRKQFPELANQTIRRNGQDYNALEYLLGDLNSYG